MVLISQKPVKSGNNEGKDLEHPRFIFKGD